MGKKQGFTRLFIHLECVTIESFLGKDNAIMKIYGSKICSGCREFKALMEARGFDAEFVEITESVANLRAFLKLRDTEHIFDPIREEGRIGIPVFVSDSGEVTLDADTALGWIGQPPMEHEESGCAGCK